MLTDIICHDCGDIVGSCTVTRQTPNSDLGDYKGGRNWLLD